MRDIFVIDSSVFIDAFTNKANPQYKQSAKDLMRHLFRNKMFNKNVGRIPWEVFDTLYSHFMKIGKTKTIKKVLKIVEPDFTTFKNNDSKLTVREAILKLAYRLSIKPETKLHLITNDPKMRDELLKEKTIFFVIDSNDAVNIITHPNFYYEPDN